MKDKGGSLKEQGENVKKNFLSQKLLYFVLYTSLSLLEPERLFVACPFYFLPCTGKEL
jgi:hypothetical protein